MEGNDIYESIMHLLFHPTVPFTHVYWQLNVGFDCPTRATFEEWVDKSYNPGISKLMKVWIETMEKEGRVLGIVPFLSLMDTMLDMDEHHITDSSALGLIKPVGYGTDPSKPVHLGSVDDFNPEDDAAFEKEQREAYGRACAEAAAKGLPPPPTYPARPLRQLRCGIGQTAFSISTDGVVSGCPCGVGEEWNTILKDFRTIANPTKELTEAIKFGPPCTQCDIADVCGGRCVYCNHTQFWGRSYERIVCNKVIRHLVTEVKNNLPKVKALLLIGRISREPFRWPAEAYSLEVIP